MTYYWQLKDELALPYSLKDIPDWCFNTWMWTLKRTAGSIMTISLCDEQAYWCTVCLWGTRLWSSCTKCTFEQLKRKHQGLFVNFHFKYSPNYLGNTVSVQHLEISLHSQTQWKYNPISEWHLMHREDSERFILCKVTGVICSLFTCKRGSDWVLSCPPIILSSVPKLATHMCQRNRELNKSYEINQNTKRFWMHLAL